MVGSSHHVAFWLVCKGMTRVDHDFELKTSVGRARLSKHDKCKLSIVMTCLDREVVGLDETLQARPRRYLLGFLHLSHMDCDRTLSFRDDGACGGR